jgi:DNA-binding NarL/FixJ family response regulator
MTVSVVIVDDHPVFVAGMRAVLDEFDDIEVVAVAGDGEEAVAVATEHHPDVVLMDLRMPGTDGLAATAKIRTSIPDTRVLVLTMDEDADSVFAALRVGANGYLLKEADSDDVHRAVLSVARGEGVFGPRVAEHVMSFFASGGSSSGSTAFPQLTQREREVLELLARGLDNASIARRLVLSPKTVRNRVSDVLAKLHAGTRAEAVAMARDAGLGDPA